MSPRSDVSMTADEVEAFLSEPRVIVLSTLQRDGWPHSAAMWYVPAGDEIWMWTYAKSQKAANLRRDPRCSLHADDGLSYNELRGVLIQGQAKLLQDFDRILEIGKALYERYTLPSTGLPAERGPIAELERQAHKRVGISVPMERVATWDHRKLGN